MGSLRLQGFDVQLLKAPLVQPFRVATGEHRFLENLLLTLIFSDGTCGYGEAAIATHITQETIPQTFKNLQSTGQWFLKQDISDYLYISSQLHERLPNNKAAVAAVEMALIDGLTKIRGIPLWKYFGSRPKKLISDITVVIASLQETEETIKKYFKRGFRHFKVKIGKDFDLDIKRVMAVKRLTRNSTIICDANQGFSADQTLKFLKTLKAADIKPSLMEQPVPKKDWEGLKKLTRSCDVDICADESVSSLSDAVLAIKEKAVDAINIKLMKTGIFHSREIALLAKVNGIKLMIGGMMESSLAMTAAAHLAAGLGCFDFVDLDTPFFIKDGRHNNPYLNHQGVYDLTKVEKGVGIDP